MSGCILSPYGTYTDVATCTTENKCGWKWKCDSSGNPIEAPDGTLASAEECMCFTCTADGCVVQEDGLGEHRDLEACSPVCSERASRWNCEPAGPVMEFDGEMANADDCKYVCDGAGNKEQAASGLLHADLKCYNCDPNSSSPDTAVAVSGIDGNADTDAACTYTCVSDGTASTLQYAADGSPYSSISGCYNCDGGDNPLPVDGVDGNTADSAADTCRYTCDDGVKVHEPVSANGLRYNEMNCYLCTGATQPSALSGIVSSTDPSSVSGEHSCLYWCKNGNTAAVRDDERDDLDRLANAKPTSPESKCFTCSGDAGPDSTCGPVSDYEQGEFKTLSACDSDETAMCGWGYGCVDDACALSELATRGTSEETCQLDSEAKCGWKFGCFNKYACVDGVSCAAVPEAECVGNTDEDGNAGTLTCYDSSESCIESSACNRSVSGCDSPLEGEWYLYHTDEDGNTVNMVSYGPDPFVFEEDSIDAEGFRWYISNTSVIPAISIGLKHTESSGSVEMKFRGWHQASTQFWSGASYNDPDAVEIASMSPGECFVLDSVELNQLCGNCFSSTNDEITGDIVLQRAELCAPGIPALPGTDDELVCQTNA